MKNKPVDVPAICPFCDGALYIEITPETTDDETVKCAHCGRLIMVGDALEEYDRINFPRNEVKTIKADRGVSNMSFINILDPDTNSLDLTVTSGKEDICNNIFSDKTKLFFNAGLPGIIWFDYSMKKEYEVLDYTWNGPRYQDVMIQDNDSSIHTRGGRKGRVAGAIIGTILMPGIGTVIGAAVGTGRKEDSKTRGQTISHIETKEIPVDAHMRLRDLERDQIVHIAFQCTAAMDARIRNNITVNLEPGNYIDFEEPMLLPEPEKEPVTKDVISQLRELKELLDEGAITREEYEVLKKKII